MPNLLIGLREVLEGGLVVSILLAAVRRTDRRSATGAVWVGAAAATLSGLSSDMPLVVRVPAGQLLAVVAAAVLAGLAGPLATCPPHVQTSGGRSPRNPVPKLGRRVALPGSPHEHLGRLGVGCGYR